MSLFYDRAAAAYRECRAEFELWREAQYQAASDDTGGNLLNARGRAAHVNPWSLFIGSTDRALLYASEELVEWWTTRPRMTYAAWERQWIDGGR